MEKPTHFYFTRIFWRNTSYALAGLILLILLTMIYLRIYTHHGRASAVPDFSDMPLEDAISLIEKKKLRYEIFDSQFVAGKGFGLVIDQHPAPDFLVKKNRKIFFTISSSSPGEILMPNLVGITLREARVKLEGYGLNVGKLFYRYDISENIVLEQQAKGKIIESGDSILKGSAVDLVLGKGLADVRRMVPNLIGMSVDQAKIEANDATFYIGAIIEDNSVAEASPDRKPFIYKQIPESHPEILRPLGSTISLYVTLDSAKIAGDKEEDLIWNELNEENEAEN
ncbi:MAG: PASTA domain-containing protein [Bacteroidota bacterium]|nr:MAG: PASTA domain-containing protein [Bacteroidota bacterium]